MKRKLTPEELCLWKAQLKGIKPLSKGMSDSAEIDHPNIEDKIASQQIRPSKKKLERAAVSPLSQPLGRKEIRRIKVEARLDLHGLTLAEGREALERFLIHAQERGVKTILVITGKGSLSSENTLRRQVTRWLREIPLRGFVSFFQHPAKPQDGGRGAFYIGVRKKK